MPTEHIISPANPKESDSQQASSETIQTWVKNWNDEELREGTKLEKEWGESLEERLKDVEHCQECFGSKRFWRILSELGLNQDPDFLRVGAFLGKIFKEKEGHYPKMNADNPDEEKEEIRKRLDDFHKLPQADYYSDSVQKDVQRLYKKLYRE